MDAKTLALYLGCDVKIGDRQGTLMQVGCNGEETSVLTSVTDEESGFYGEAEFVTFTEKNLSQIKLLLRPLSSMTEEEKTEWSKRKQRKGYMAQVHADNTLWLLSKGFDLFGLIEKGEAVSMG